MLTWPRIVEPMPAIAYVHKIVGAHVDAGEAGTYFGH